MTTFTLPEEILGIPLFVPTIYDFFEIDDPGMPDGGPCLIVRGDLNNGYKAFIAAPSFPEPNDFFNTSDVRVGRQWSMSCWLRLENLAVANTEAIMLGCSTQYSVTNAWANDKNVTFPFALGVAGTNLFRVFRDPLNNVASPNQNKSFHFTGSWEAFQNYWFLLVITQQTLGAAGSSMPHQMYAYMDTYAPAFAGDPDCSGSTPSGTYTSPRYLHIGAYHAGGVGRADLWRIGKWAFHDHALTHAERILMWQQMMGTEHSYLDDFNRATLGKNWLDVSSMVGITLVSNQIKWTAASQKAMTWVRCLGSPNHYSQMDVVQNGYMALVTVRNGACLTPSLGFYSAGWSQWNMQWVINNGSTQLASAGGPAPTPPYTIRLEVETDISNNVQLRLYQNGALKLSAADSSGAKRLYESNTGVLLMGGSGDAIADNFRCGTLAVTPVDLTPKAFYRGVGTPVWQYGSAAMVIPAPASSVNGDKLFLHISSRANTTTFSGLTGDGWSLMQRTTLSAVDVMEIWTKVKTASDASATFTPSELNWHGAYMIACYDVDSVSAIQVTTGSASGTGNGHTAPQFHAPGGELILSFMGWRYGRTPDFTNINAACTSAWKQIISTQYPGPNAQAMSCAWTRGIGSAPAAPVQVAWDYGNVLESRPYLFNQFSLG